LLFYSVYNDYTFQSKIVISITLVNSGSASSHWRQK